MAPRNKRCASCPKVAPALTPTVVEVTLSSAGEAKRIWDNILTATAFSIDMIESYIQLDLPGMNYNSLRALRTRLDNIINGSHTSG